MTIEIKAEHNKAKGGERTSLGLMIEVTAPVAPIAETAIKRKDKGLICCPAWQLPTTSVSSPSMTMPRWLLK